MSRDETLVDPGSWHHDYALISRPGNDEVQLKLLRDYATNSPCTPGCMSISAPPGCHCWRSGAEGTKYSGLPGRKHSPRICPVPRSVLVDGGHFLLESALDEVAGLIGTFLAKQRLAA